MANGVVLIADPDADARQRYELALARSGFNVVSAGDGAAALRLASRLVPDGLLTEILLPDLDGFHLAQRLRRQTSTNGIGIVAVTSYAGDDLKQRAAESGIDTVLAKTQSVHEIVRAVHTMARRSATLRDESVALREEVDIQLSRGRELRARAKNVIERSREVGAAISRVAGDLRRERADREMLAEADGAREMMLVDRARGEHLFDVLLERYGHHPLLHYKRGEAYRATGRRKLAHQEFVLAAERLPDGVWRERARFAAMRTRSHHERTPHGGE